MKIDPSLPAFPFFSPECGTSQGLTIRAHFAAMCLQGMLANRLGLEAVAEKCAADNTVNPYEAFAVDAVLHADALIAELNK